jgi:CotS family spore coat protein
MSGNSDASLHSAASIKVEEVLSQYPLNAPRSVLLSDKGKKAVWQMDGTARYSLKKMPNDEPELRFIVYGNEYLTSHEVKVPRIVPTGEGELYARNPEGLFVLTEWIEGRKPVYDSRADLRLVMESLARFHAGSRGYEAPPRAEARSLLLKWPAHYERKASELARFKEMALASNDGFSEVFLVYVDEFVDICTRVSRVLLESEYTRWCRRVGETRNLCHQDFSAKNLRVIPSGDIYVFDIDSFTYDLPARDLRKICNKVSKGKEGWDAAATREMLAWYSGIVPLTTEEVIVTLLDIEFPHLFCGIANKFYLNREPEWGAEKFIKQLRRLVEIERSKQPELAELRGMNWT